MIPETFEARLRAGEYFHDLKLWPNAWTVVRCDGRSFSAFTEKQFKKPFDPQFHQHMLTTAEALMVDLGGIYAYTESDEISVLLPPNWSGFSREWEKLVSLSAGIVSAAFSLASGHRVHFDARIWMGATIDDVQDYFRWRQTDSERCSLNGWCYWTLRKSGLSGRRADTTMNSLIPDGKLGLLAEHGVDFHTVPAWQRRGSGLLWETYEKEGYDPKQQQTVIAQRRRLVIREELPGGDEYGTLIGEICQEAVRNTKSGKNA